jgi:hypothetical protein
MHGRLLMHVDVGATGALLRVGIAGAFATTFHRLRPEAGPAAAALALAILLFAVKACAAVARRLVPVPPVVRAHQEWRRQLARFHDSYQVRKLFWFGAGILAATAAAAPPPRWGIALGTTCLLSGAVAEAVWRRKNLPTAPPMAPRPA